MSLWAPGFVIQATRGLVRDPRTRRAVMFALILLAMLMLFAGATFLRSLLDYHEHAAGFILYWLVCAWITLTALLLAFLDLLIARREAQMARKRLREDFSRTRPNE